MSGSKVTVRIYRTQTGKGKYDWRWRVTASNGRIIGASCEGYRNRAACLHNLRYLTRVAVIPSAKTMHGRASFEWECTFERTDARANPA